jgi:hypothetical protein
VKRMKGVEDVNICSIGAQGIVGVGSTTPTCIAWFRVGAFRRTARGGFPAGRITFFPFLC